MILLFLLSENYNNFAQLYAKIDESENKIRFYASLKKVGTDKPNVDNCPNE